MPFVPLFSMVGYYFAIKVLFDCKIQKIYPKTHHIQFSMSQANTVHIEYIRKQCMVFSATIPYCSSLLQKAFCLPDLTTLNQVQKPLIVTHGEHTFDLTLSIHLGQGPRTGRKVAIQDLCFSVSQ